MSRRFALLLLTLVVGCQSLEKADECRAIARLANPALAEIDRDRAEVTAPKYRIIATKYEALANAMGQVKIRTKRIAEAVNDYQRMLHEAARDARTFADALESKDETRILGERSSTSRTMRHEASALARFDVACKGR